MHVQNRSPNAALENMTPEEAWSGEKPVVEYFRVFGCITHIHIPDQKRSKMDDKSKKCVLLGVSDESKAWKLYIQSQRKLWLARMSYLKKEKAGTGKI